MSKTPPGSESNAYERLVWARARAGYASAADAARALGIPEPTYQGHENGTRGFTKSAPVYARKFRVPLNWLLTGEGQPPLYPVSTGGAKSVLIDSAYTDPGKEVDEMAARATAQLLKIWSKLPPRAQLELLAHALELSPQEEERNPTVGES